MSFNSLQQLVVLFTYLLTYLSHAAFRRMLGGAMLVRTGSHGSCVGRRVLHGAVQLKVYTRFQQKGQWDNARNVFGIDEHMA